MTDELKNRLNAIANQTPDTEATKDRSYPPGWQPGVTWEGTSGQLITPPLSGPPGSWDEYLIRYGLDPATHEVIEDAVRFTAWDGWRRDTPDGEAYTTTLFSFKATIKLKQNQVDSDWANVYDTIAKASSRPAPFFDGDDALVVALSDWQIGNSDGGGVEAQLQALADLVNQIPDHVADVRKLGHPVSEIVIAGMGDLYEQCANFYPHQEFTVELDRREQSRVIRRALRDIILTVHPLAPKITVTAVGGNHGEARLKGVSRYTTTTNDNDDVAVFEALQEGFALNPDFSNISWRLPAERLAVSHRIGDQIVAFTHGHLAKFRTTATNSMWEWWKNQSHGRHYPGVADADTLISGHFHHFSALQQEGRNLFICPSLSRVSDYFGDANGVRSAPGTLTLVITKGGWDALRII